MSSLPVKEVSHFFRSNGMKYEIKLIIEWLTEDPLSPDTDQVSEKDIHRFNEWLSCKGTAYEEGIDNETKISRLHEEINILRKEVEELKWKNAILEELLGITPF
jgi:hypothetical protein